MGIVHAILPLPPGINASYKIVSFKTKTGKIAHKLAATPELEAFKQEAQATLYEQKGIFDWVAIRELQQSKQKRQLSITIDFYYPTLWKRDIDGGEKAVIDALFACIELNDNLIVDKHTRKMIDRKYPRCDIAISIFEEVAV